MFGKIHLNTICATCSGRKSGKIGDNWRKNRGRKGRLTHQVRPGQYALVFPALRTWACACTFSVQTAVRCSLCSLADTERMERACVWISRWPNSKRSRNDCNDFDLELDFLENESGFISRWLYSYWGRVLGDRTAVVVHHWCLWMKEAF